MTTSDAPEEYPGRVVFLSYGKTATARASLPARLGHRLRLDGRFPRERRIRLARLDEVGVRSPGQSTISIDASASCGFLPASREFSEPLTCPPTGDGSHLERDGPPPAGRHR